MDLQWNDKRRRSTGSRSGVARSEETEIKVYHRRSVEERDAAAARRQAIREKKEEEAVEGMKQLGEKVTWSMYKRPPVVFPIYIPSKVEKKVSAAILLCKMKKGMETFVRRIRYGPHIEGNKKETRVCLCSESECVCHPE
jgi:hypothetical protein